MVAVIRELFGSGSLMGYRLLELAGQGGWYEPNSLLLLPTSAFFIIGGIIWAIVPSGAGGWNRFDLPGRERH